MPSFYEFFAGGGMARIGLGPEWRCLFANDLNEKKAVSYRENHQGGTELLVKDVGKVTTAELPGVADLIWASFPCQDLSLAGMGAGLRGSRSGTFSPFWERVQSLKSESRQPALVVLENVCRALTSHDGEDFHRWFMHYVEPDTGLVHWLLMPLYSCHTRDHASLSLVSETTSILR